MTGRRPSGARPAAASGPGSLVPRQRRRLHPASLTRPRPPRSVPVRVVRRLWLLMRGGGPGRRPVLEDRACHVRVVHALGAAPRGAAWASARPASPSTCPEPGHGSHPKGSAQEPAGGAVTPAGPARPPAVTARSRVEGDGRRNGVCAPSAAGTPGPVASGTVTPQWAGPGGVTRPNAFHPWGRGAGSPGRGGTGEEHVRVPSRTSRSPRGACPRGDEPHLPCRRRELGRVRLQGTGRRGRGPVALGSGVTWPGPGSARRRCRRTARAPGIPVFAGPSGGTEPGLVLGPPGVADAAGAAHGHRWPRDLVRAPGAPSGTRPCWPGPSCRPRRTRGRRGGGAPARPALGGPCSSPHVGASVGASGLSPTHGDRPGP